MHKRNRNAGGEYYQGSILITCLFLFLTINQGFSQNVQFNEFNESALDSQMRYGETIKGDSEWQSFAQGVKSELKARWEKEAENEIMKKMGITGIFDIEDIAGTTNYTLFQNAAAEWEADAELGIMKNYGVWMAKKDWNISIEINQIKNLILQETWKDQTQLENIPVNISNTIVRVGSSVNVFVDQYKLKLELFKSNAALVDTLTPEAKEKYETVIAEMAKMHLNALLSYAKMNEWIELNKYKTYMGRLQQYQMFTVGSNYNFNEMFFSNYIQQNISNVNSNANSMISPISFVKTQIMVMQSNLAAISERLQIGETPEEDTTVAIKNWEEMVESFYREGLQQWSDAMDGLLAKMYTWRTNALVGYAQGQQEWQSAYNELTNARVQWNISMNKMLVQGISNWNDKIDLAQTNMMTSVLELQQEISRVNASYDEYTAGMTQIFLEGSSTLGVINQNVDWLTKKVTVLQKESDYQYFTTSPYPHVEYVFYRYPSKYHEWTNFNAQLTFWNKMKTDYNTMITKTQSKLWDELFSGTLGQGMFTNNTTGTDLYFRSLIEMDFAKKSEEMKYQEKRLKIAKELYQFSLIEQTLDYAGVQNNITDLSNKLTIAAANLATANTAMTAAIDLSKQAQSNAGSAQAYLNVIKSNLALITPAYEAAKQDYEIQQEILALVSAQKETLVARATNYIMEALGDYAVAMAQYNYARSDYFNTLLYSDFEKNEYMYYNVLKDYKSLWGTSSNSIDVYNAFYKGITNGTITGTVILTKLNSLNSNWAELYHSETNSGVLNGVLGMLERVESVSNFSMEMFSALLMYLKTGTNSLALYSTNNYLAVPFQRSFYLQAVLDAVTNFAGSVRNSINIPAALTNWAVNYSPIGGMDKQAIVYGVWNYIQSHSNIQAALKSNTAPISALLMGTINDYISNASVLDKFLKSDYSLSEEGAYGFLKESYGSPAIDGWSTEYFSHMMDLLAGYGGELSGILSYYDYYLSECDNGMYYLSEMAVQMAGQVIELRKSLTLTNLNLTLSAVSNKNQLVTAVLQLTNYIGKYGAAIDSYLNEMLDRAMALSLNTNIAQNFISNNMSTYKSLQNKMYYLGGMLNNPKPGSLDFLHYYYAISSNSTALSARNYILLETLNYSTNFANEAEVYTYLTNRLKKSYYIEKNEDIDVIATEMLGEYVKNYIVSKIGYTMSSVNIEGLSDLQTNHIFGMFSGFGTNVQEFAQQYYDIYCFNSIKHILEKNVYILPVITLEGGFNSIINYSDEIALISAISNYYWDVLMAPQLSKSEKTEYAKDYVLKKVQAIMTTNTNMEINNNRIESIFGAYNAEFKGYAYDVYYTIFYHRLLDTMTNVSLTGYKALAKTYDDVMSKVTNAVTNDYAAMLYAKIDYRNFEGLSEIQKGFLNNGMISALDYYLYFNSIGNTNLATTAGLFFGQGSDIIYAAQTNYEALSLTSSVLTEAISATNRLLMLNQQWNTFGSLKGEIGLLTNIANLTQKPHFQTNISGINSEITNVVTNTGYQLHIVNDGFDFTASNYVFMNTNMNDGLNCLYQMYLGLKGFVSNYNAKVGVYNTNIQKIATAATNLTAGILVYNDGTLLKTAYQNYMGSAQLKSDPESRLKIWTTALLSVDEDYTKNAAYITAETNYKVNLSNINVVEKQYQTGLTNYFKKLDIYYNKLADVKTAKQTWESHAYTNELLAKLYWYSTLPLAMGAETNAGAFVKISNYIDVYKDYTNRQAVYNTTSNSLVLLANSIVSQQNWMTYNTNLKSDYVSFTNDYRSYADLINALDVVRQKEGPLAEQFNTAQQAYYQKIAGTFGNTWISNKILSSLVDKISTGVVSKSDIDTVIQRVLEIGRAHV